MDDKLFETDNSLSKVKWEDLLDSAVSEIEYSIKTKHTKSEEDLEYYLRNAVRFIEEAKYIMTKIQRRNQSGRL